MAATTYEEVTYYVVDIDCVRQQIFVTYIFGNIFDVRWRQKEMLKRFDPILSPPSATTPPSK